MIRPKSFFTVYDIKLATLNDFDDINRIQKQAFATPWSRDLIRSAIVNDKYDVRIIGAEQPAVAGFYIAHTIHDRSNLDNLAVDIPVRGLGFGGKLVEDWITRAELQQMATLSLQVNTQNLSAQKLYRDFDFHKTRLLSGYYPNGDDAFQMEMTLSPRPARMS